MHKKLPEWLRKRIPSGTCATDGILQKFNLNTVCVSADCPNRRECFSRREATFMILGRVCTRNCRFCSVKKGIPADVDRDEPRRIADAVEEMGLRYVVVTSVTRDDLEDGGASQFAEVARKLRSVFGKNLGIEFLVPDLKGDSVALYSVINEDIDVLNHNIETVERLYSEVRPEADYKRSISLLGAVKAEKSGLFTKSGLMLGLGEDPQEIVSAMQDLRRAGCDFLTLGQYLQPGPEQLEVKEFISPGRFDDYKKEALRIGFRNVASGPFVRSSYNASSMIQFPVRREGVKYAQET